MSSRSLDSQRWREVRGLFGDLLELPPEHRKQALAAAQIDATQLRELIDLLASADAAGSFLEEPAAVRIARPLDQGLTGLRLGAYELREKIGQGGMSVVYAAVRTDRVHSQKVAVKLLKRGFVDSAGLQRFYLERQILARLEHPHIARLLDGGSTADGVPYAVVEFVDGVPIDAYCCEQGSSLRNRLHLFQKVCHAVQFAHRNLIVHRDLKPNNVLVAPDGEPKLLDFGIAKLLGEPSPEAPVTGTGLRVLTPGYASPEQYRGDAITTASDVYSLGILGYRLLSGALPFSTTAGLHGADPHQRQATAHPLSAMLQDSREAGYREPLETVRRDLRGDLDAIFLKAIRWQPTERYLSVEGLLEDLNRHENGLPVRARRGTLTYRTGKWLRRHRLGLLIGGLFLLAILTFTAVTVWQSGQLAEERDLSRSEAAKAEETLDFLIGLFEEADPERDHDEPPTVEQFLDRGGNRARDELATQPELRAPLLRALAEVNHQMGRYGEAESLRREELTLRRQTGTEPELVRSLNGLGHTLLLMNRPRSAQAAYREALVRGWEIFPSDHREQIDSLIGLGIAHHELGNLDRAGSLLRETLEQLRKKEPTKTRRLPETLYSLALVERDAGHAAAAEEYLQEALALERALSSDGPQALSLLLLASLRAQEGALEVASDLLEEGLKTLRATMPAHHPQIAYALAQNGSIARQLGQLGQAEQFYREALDFKKPPFDEGSVDRASLLNNLGIVLRDQNKLSAAEQITRQALVIYRNHFPDGHPKTVATLSNLGLYRARQGDLQGARKVYRQALSLGEEVLGEEHPALAHTALRWGEMELDRGAPSVARPLLQRALRLRQASLGPDHHLTALALGALGLCLQHQADSKSAMEMLRESHRVLLEKLGPDHPDTLQAAQRLDVGRKLASSLPQ